ncbi:unnamed protein product [Trichogramma brassicae]|uniref:Uncharacterized protein n=1 Tax=Trichogramma brassicae TaxID=86971 RepID=A0A6H5IAQ4_9HYME|nr:unnamed protein product [Trichogramma brassicae]
MTMINNYGELVFVAHAHTRARDGLLQIVHCSSSSSSSRVLLRLTYIYHYDTCLAILSEYIVLLLLRRRRVGLVLLLSLRRSRSPLHRTALLHRDHDQWLLRCVALIVPVCARDDDEARRGTGEQRVSLPARACATITASAHQHRRTEPLYRRSPRTNHRQSNVDATFSDLSSASFYDKQSSRCEKCEVYSRLTEPEKQKKRTEMESHLECTWRLVTHKPMAIQCMRGSKIIQKRNRFSLKSNVPLLYGNRHFDREGRGRRVTPPPPPHYQCSVTGLRAYLEKTAHGIEILRCYRNCVSRNKIFSRKTRSLLVREVIRREKDHRLRKLNANDDRVLDKFV